MYVEFTRHTLVSILEVEWTRHLYIYIHVCRVHSTYACVEWSITHVIMILMVWCVWYLWLLRSDVFAILARIVKSVWYPLYDGEIFMISNVLWYYMSDIHRTMVWYVWYPTYYGVMSVISCEGWCDVSDILVRMLWCVWSTVWMM